MLIVRDELDIIFLIDCSSSTTVELKTQMDKIVKSIIQDISMGANENCVNINMRTLIFYDLISDMTFSENEEPNSEELEEIKLANRNKVVVEAINGVSKILQGGCSGIGKLPPVVIFISNGVERSPEYHLAIEDMKNNMGPHGLRIAIGIGNYDKASLKDFACNVYVKDKVKPAVFNMDSLPNICNYICWEIATESEPDWD